MTPSDANGATPDETWSLPAAWVIFVAFVMAVMVVAGAFFVIGSVNGRHGPPLIFMALWFAILGWNIYWWLFRVAYRVELIGRTLHWRAPFRTGTMPVDSIESARRFFVSPYTCVLRASGYPSLMVFTQLRSFTPMLATLHRLNPSVPAQL